jgi:SIR2-like domain
MRIHDVDLPQVVIDAQKRGELVLFAGAGVSMDAPSNYPNFLDLATELGGTAYPKEKDELIDRYLGRLVERGIPVHERVKTRLSDPTSRPNHVHESIIRLFGSADAIRIVTTNFDDHFCGAAQAVYASVPEVYRAPALPLGDDFKGIVHLHGSVLDDAKKLVLTDADFGRAYLTQGWARRFVQQLFAKFVVLFVGYSHQDLPLLYLARGISAAEDGPGRYAITPPENDTFWVNLGIKPVHYPLRVPPLAKHGALGGCLATWAEIANLGSLGTETRIRGLTTSDRPLSLEEDDFLRHALLDIGTLRYFTRHAKDPRWLEWIAEHTEFSAIFVPGASLNERSAQLAFWFAEVFAIPHFAVALELVRRKNQMLSPALWHAVAQRFHAHATAGDPLRLWVPILLATMPANGHSDFLAYMIDHCAVPGDEQTILQLFRALSTPKLKLKRRYFPPEDGKPAVPDAEVEPIAHDHTMLRAYRSKIQPHLDVFAKGIALIVTTTFEEANTLLAMYGKAGPKGDPISMSRGSVTSRAQDFLHNGFSVLIDAGADVLRWANDHDSKFASSLVGQWIESDPLVLQRLAISGMAGYPSLTSEEKLAWAISNQLVENVGLKNETFALLAAVYASSGEPVRAELVRQAENAMNPAGEDYERYEFFNLLSWLHTHAPNCALVTEKLEAIQARHPQWEMREHPDFNSWISGGAVQPVPDSPIQVSQIEAMNLDALLDESTRLAEVKDTFGEPFQAGFLQEIARTAAKNFVWSEGIAAEALERKDLPAEIWSALVRGWSTHHTPEEWASVLAIVEQLEPVYDMVLYEMSSLLKGAVERKEDGFPIALFGLALARANAVWAACVALEPPLPETAENWVTVAINRTSGYLLDFYFEAFRLLWPKRQEEQGRIDSLLGALEAAIGGDGPASEIARILVSAKASLLADVAQDWYTEHGLPLLAAPANPRQSEQHWDGYLVWGTWTQTMLPGLIPAYLRHLPEITGASDDRSRMFCSHLAGFAVFGAVDPLENGWLGDFLTRAQRRERMHWVGSITDILREGDDQAKESAWDRWIKRYLELRVQSNPIALDAEESGAMCEWVLALRSHYAEILELLLAGPAPDLKRGMFYYRLQEAALLDHAPALTARFLTALLSREDGQQLWDLEQVHMMVSDLIDLDATEPALRQLCEQLGRIGSPRALEFQSRLRA